LSDDLRECSFIEHGQVGQHLAINLDRSLLQTVHEHAVWQAMLTCSRIDTRDPQCAELALPLAAVTIGILPRLHHRFFGDAIDAVAAAAVTLGLVQNFLVARARRYTTFNSCHFNYSLCVGHHGSNRRRVGCMNFSRSTQLTLVLGGLLGKDVALERLCALDAPAGANDKAFLRAAFGFHLWHNDPILFDDAGRFLAETLENPEPLIRDSLYYYCNGESLAPSQYKLIFVSARSPSPSGGLPFSGTARQFHAHPGRP
jgi:hypothetical protein